MGRSNRAPLWHFVLEAAHHDPLRAQEIEAGVSQYWWECYLADRDARITAARAARSATGQQSRQYLPIPEERARYIIGPDGQLTRAA